MKPLIEILYGGRRAWAEDAVRKAFSDVIQDRFPRIESLEKKANDERKFQLRVNAHTEAGAVPFAALVAPLQPSSGAYGGMSLVVFPPDDSATEGPGEPPCLIGMVVGTNGLAPDELILGRPGHARKCAAIAQWLRASGVFSLSWAKQDPTRIDQRMPEAVRDALRDWSGAVKDYGQVLYLVLRPPPEIASDGARRLLSDALAALLDLFFDEREIAPRAAYRNDRERVRHAWLGHLLPGVDESRVASILTSRRFAVLEGPPGTGKTRMAYRLLDGLYGGRGRVIQFHPGTTYESFVGGLGPQPGRDGALSFAPIPGHLMRACEEARADSANRHLLVVDEINRADLSKVLGEAILLFEPGQPDRTVRLAHEFPGYGSSLSLPPNLDLLGTMNSADRSIAILDVAVRRRFAFLQLHPQPSVVEAHAGSKMREVFARLLHLFLEHAGPEAMALMPGHAYFLSSDERAADDLQTQLRPLLEEYLAQGYVAGFADEIRAFVDTLPAPA